MSEHIDKLVERYVDTDGPKMAAAGKGKKGGVPKYRKKGKRFIDMDSEEEAPKS